MGQENFRAVPMMSVHSPSHVRDLFSEVSLLYVVGNDHENPNSKYLICRNISKISRYWSNDRCRLPSDGSNSDPCKHSPYPYVSPYPCAGRERSESQACARLLHEAVIKSFEDPTHTAQSLICDRLLHLDSRCTHVVNPNAH